MNRQKILESKRRWNLKNRDRLRKYHASYYRKNKNQILTRVRKYASENSDKIMVYRHDYYHRNKEKINKQNKLYAEKHRESLRMAAKIWRHNNSSNVKLSTRKWKMNNPEKVKAQSAVCHGIRDGVLPKISEFTCEECHKNAEVFHHFMGYEPEHWLDVMPLCRQCHYDVENEVI